MKEFLIGFAIGAGMVLFVITGAEVGRLTASSTDQHDGPSHAALDYRPATAR